MKRLQSQTAGWMEMMYAGGTVSCARPSKLSEPMQRGKREVERLEGTTDSGVPRDVSRQTSGG
jgi:hypothetical protein